MSSYNSFVNNQEKGFKKKNFQIWEVLKINIKDLPIMMWFIYT